MENSSHKEIYYVNFNQDASSLAVCHEAGYHLYNMGSIEHTNGTGLEPAHQSNIPEKTAIVERLFQSSLITLVSLNHSRKLQVFHFQKGTEICSHSYTSAIKAVRMNRKRVVVCLEESVHVHNIRDMRLMHMIRDTPTNREGLIDLCSSDHSCYLAYPGSATHGHVNIFDADPLVATCTIAAHDAPLAALRFNADGNKLATASVKGTVIRIFAIPSGERLYEFTRGMKRCVQINSLAFSADSKFLCSSSNTETVHIFSLARAEEQKQQTQTSRGAEETDQSLTSWVSYFSQQASNYLPQQMNELLLRDKSYATARLPIVGTKTCCAMPRIANRDYLAVASTDGYLFCYSLPQEPGECTLARQYRIGPLAEEKDGGENEGRVVPTAAQAIYPSVPQHQGDDMAPIGLGTSPKNTPPVHTTPSPPLNASPLSSSPIVSSPIKTRRKTVSQSSSSNAMPIIAAGTSPASIQFSSSPVKTIQTATAKSQQQKGKSTIRRISSNSSSSESSSDSIGRRSNDSDDIERNAKNDTLLDLNNPDDFPPLDNFD
jgi:autophagy-related protein 18